MNDFHKKVMEARVQESNWRWIIRKIGFGIAAVMFLLAFIIVASSGGSSSKTETDSSVAFVMSSHGDYVAEHTFTGSSYEPSGYYKITCTKGHGLLTDGNERGYMLAADEYLGQKHGSATYAQSVTLFFNRGDLLKSRNYHSSKFKLEFHYIGETLE
jgi:hypothetical protein